MGRRITLTFHGIGAIDRPLDDGEGDGWVGAELFGAVLDRVGHRDDVHLTFDDGNASDLVHALPQLQRRGLRGTFFLVADRLGQPGFVDAAGVRALTAAGMTVGCHGLHHVSWRGLSDPELDAEISGAKVRLEAIAGRPVTEASCPFGAYDRRVLRALRRAGYERVYTSDGGPADPQAWLQARTSVRASDDARTVLAGAAARGGLAQQAKLVVKRWR